jgi:2-polyprenyl-6-methoxyphenol hydroxylase-like FAD-dependent oxidoreductase
MASPSILIVGAGPAGLVLSLHLHALGIPHRLIERNTTIATTSRAIIVQARTLELYARLSPALAQDVHAAGLEMARIAVYSNHRFVTALDFKESASTMSAWGGPLSLSQDVHERPLFAELARVGGRVERGVELTALAQHPGHVDATLRHTDDGREERGAYAYVVGCDGAHSAVRQLSDIGMPGGTYPLRFFVADVVPAAIPAFLETPSVNYCSSAEDFVLAIPHPGAVRIIGTAPEHGDVDWEACLPAVRRNVPALEIGAVRWFTTYRSHHRVADAFRRGRVFLAGDAGHLHSPTGGQGMNTGLGDAINLAWKLAAALRNPDHPHVDAWLDSYEAERRAFALTLVHTTDTTFTALTNAGWKGWSIRRVLFPWVLPSVVAALGSRLGPSMLATVSQFALNYREQGCGLDVGAVGAVHAGDRMPWVAGVGVGAVQWEAVVFGTAPEAVKNAGIRVREESWSEEARKKGFVQDAAYIVRPDGYVGAVLVGEGGPELTEWMAKWAVAA